MGCCFASYYVFVGGLENFENISYTPVKTIRADEPVIEEPVVVANEPEEISYDEPEATSTEVEFSEPFEYFVDFDDPIGEPLTDKDLYN